RIEPGRKTHEPRRLARPCELSRVHTDPGRRRGPADQVALAHPDRADEVRGLVRGCEGRVRDRPRGQQDAPRERDQDRRGEPAYAGARRDVAMLATARHALHLPKCFGQSRSDRTLTVRWSREPDGREKTPEPLWRGAGSLWRS